jgi:hypothetical protein
MMPRGTRPLDVAQGILYYRDRAPELMLPNVLILCHGDPGKLYVGGRPQRMTTSSDAFISDGNAGCFFLLKGKDIGTIWLKGCNVAMNPEGKELCENMAKAAQCNVVAGVEEQWGRGGVSHPLGAFDNYVGRTICWDARGKMSDVGQDGAGVPTAI